MGDVITYVIIGLFAIFFIYFAYTLIDTLFLSKRARRSAVSVSHLKPEIQTQKEEEKTETSVETEEDTETQEMVSRNDAETGTVETKKESEAEEVTFENSIPKKEKKKLFSGFFSKTKKQKLEDTTPTFVANKIDDAYLVLVSDFVTKTKGSWNQKEFYEFILTLVAKGYDKKPSEVNRDVLLAKDKLRAEEIEHEKVVPKPESVVVEQEKESIEVVKEEDFEKEKQIKHEEQVHEASKESIHETIAKETAKKKEAHKNTRQELDKTLSEIKQLRERLKGI